MHDGYVAFEKERFKKVLEQIYVVERQLSMEQDLDACQRIMKKGEENQVRNEGHSNVEFGVLSSSDKSKQTWLSR